MKRRVYRNLGVICLALAMLVMLYPKVSHVIMQAKMRRQVAIVFSEAREIAQNDDKNQSPADNGSEDGKAEDKEESTLDNILLRMQEYNRRIFEEGQPSMSDVFTYEQAGFNLTAFGFEENIIGSLEIPALKVELPIYLGASAENMKKGAVNMGETSLPIGGENTNSVLCGHRGYGKTEMFRNIERLKESDRIYIHNLWETLTYEVSEIKVVVPNEFDKIRIQEGKDMVTLLTCHPLGKSSNRYLVFCERIPTEKTEKRE